MYCRFLLKTVLPLVLIHLNSFSFAQPTGNERLVLDIYDCVGSDTIFVSRKVETIDFHYERVKVKIEKPKPHILIQEDLPKRKFRKIYTCERNPVIFENYRIEEMNGSGFRKLVYDSLISMVTMNDHKVIRIIRNKIDTMNIEFIGLAGLLYIRIPFKIGSFKLVIDEKAVNRKRYEILPNILLSNGFSFNDFTPTDWNKYLVNPSKSLGDYNVILEYVSKEKSDTNKLKIDEESKLLNTKKMRLGFFVLEAKLFQKSSEHGKSTDLNSNQVLDKIHSHAIHIEVIDSSRNKLLFDSVFVISDLEKFTFEDCINVAYTRNNSVNFFNLVISTSKYEPKKYFTYLQTKDTFEYNLQTNDQMNKGRVVDGNFIFEVTRKAVPIENGPYVPRIEEFWNYKVTHLLTNKLLMDLDVPFFANQLKGEDSIQNPDVNFDNFVDLFISSQIPQWNGYWVYNQEKDTFVYEPFLNALENLKIDWHDEVVTGEKTFAISNRDAQGVKRQPVEFFKEAYRFEGVGLQNVTKVRSRCYQKDGELKNEKINEEFFIYKNQKMGKINE